jgi:GT2 family glycosyltransferase
MNICVILVNWNGWEDTIECLESVFRSEGHDVSVIVCDNASSDGSLEHIRSWAEGRLDVYLPPDAKHRPLSTPPAAKPIQYVEYSREVAEDGGDQSASPPLILVNTGGNLGFAGGNNVGLRYAMARGDWEAVWLLNNDAVVTSDALQELVKTLERDHGAAGMVGSTLIHYGAPEIVQSLGGCRYNKWLALPASVGAGSNSERVEESGLTDSPLAYVAGASMLVSMEMLREVGLMSEEYFLYFEELDWALRANGRYTLAHAPRSIVYHREGRSTGGGGQNTRKSLTADYYFMRGRILVTRKFAPYALPTVYAALLVAMARRAWRGEWDRVRMIARLLRAS